MNYYELIEYLDIESGSEVSYFEEMADIIESDEHIDHEALMKLFGEMEPATAASLLDEYFNEITGGLPADYSEMFSLLDQIRLELTGTIKNASEDDPEAIRDFTDRFYRFRNWYVYDTAVSVLERDEEAGVLGREFEQSVRDAIATARAGRLSGEDYAFDFSQALDYDIDYYAMSFSDLISSVDQDDDET